MLEDREMYAQGIRRGAFSILHYFFLQTFVFLKGLVSFLDVNRSVSLKAFEVGITWRDVAFKVDGLKKGFNHMTDWTLNQVQL